eukprot:CAMPEP_0179102480 /NCGR_PEP_ID=MMETSP0796-20121207/47434_1 /TAXON_ID=73915 /ORGANISM="Pyrodinium bahamense, Strain pbaha01" /LENGTH=175 /DNA_ID=CAMNT_0020800357 /DNA_START=350 /DNA_END=877 /DNA_ORIENTATION=-
MDEQRVTKQDGKLRQLHVLIRPASWLEAVLATLRHLLVRDLLRVHSGKMGQLRAPSLEVALKLTGPLGQVQVPDAQEQVNTARPAFLQPDHRFQEAQGALALAARVAPVHEVPALLQFQIQFPKRAAFTVIQFYAEPQTFGVIHKVAEVFPTAVNIARVGHILALGVERHAVLGE